MTIAIVGKDKDFEYCTETELESYLSLIEGEARRGGRDGPPEEEPAAAPEAGDGDDGPAPMDS